jgi:hypothetical protein
MGQHDHSYTALDSGSKTSIVTYKKARLIDIEYFRTIEGLVMFSSFIPQYQKQDKASRK